MANDESDHNEEGFVVKVRGLPWSTTVDEIMKFFGDCSITHGKAGIHMTMSREGRPSGEAYIEMDSEEDIEKACKRDRDHMGHRYIEVFKAKRGEMEWVIKRSGLNLENVMDDGCVRLRGLPFGCSKEEIAQFFSGLEILPNGISLPTDYTGRSTGEAYVQFVNKDVAERALQKHKEKIGHRYIEIFRSSLSEVRASIGPKMRGGPMGGFNQRPAPYDRGSRFGGMNRFNNNGRGNRGGNRDFDNGLGGWNNGNNYQSRGNNMGGGMRGNMDMGMKGGGNYRGGNDNWNCNNGGGMHCVHMRGLPFRATEQDIADFFRPLSPISIRIILENGGRASGEADVEFASHEEAVKAMSKDKSHMSHRYIELFLNSSPSPNMGGGNSGMGRGDMGRGDMGRGDMGRGDMGRGDMGRGDMGRGDMGRGDMGRGDMGRGDMGGRDMGGRDMGRGDMGRGDMGGRDMGVNNMGGGVGNMGGGGGGGGMGGGGGNMGGGNGNMGGGGGMGGGGNMGGGGGGMGAGGNMGGGGGGGGGGGNGSGSGMLGGIGNFCGGLGNNFRPGYSPNNRGYGNNQLSGNNYNSF